MNKKFFRIYCDSKKNEIRFSMVLKMILITIITATIASVLTSCQSPEKIKLEQYYIGGKELYMQNCANCHQKDGSGLQNLYPPLKNADFLQNKQAVICLIKNGISGKMSVNGKIYDQPMPSNLQLQEIDIAEIYTYINKEFSNNEALVDTWDVKIALEKCKK